MIDYILKSILCLLVLWAFYKIALEQVSAHRFKRYYLLSSLFIAAILPLITITYAIEVEPQPVLQNLQVVENDLVTAQEVVSQEKPFNWSIVLWAIYGAGVLLFGFRFTRNLLGINSKINHNEQIKESTHVNVLLHQKITPHSFLKYIFLPKQEFKDHTIAPEVLAHERAHVEQKHSWDILLIEFFRVVFWFNPLIHFYKKSIALNHEFLADRATIKNYKNIDAYVHQLFRYSGGTDHTALASSLNYSLTKKRIIMLSNKFSARKLALRLGLLLPVLALCAYLFNEEIVAKPVFTESGMATTSQGTISSESKVLEIKVTKNGKLYFMGEATSVEKLQDKIQEFLKANSTNSKNVSAKVKIDEDAPMGLFTDVKDILRKEGVNNVNISASQEAKKPEVITQAELNQISKNPKYRILEKKSPTQSQIKEWKDAAKYGV